jgi:hypothetical protein
MEIDKTDSHIFTATTTTTRMNISLETGKLRDTHSEGKVTPAARELPWRDRKISSTGDVWGSLLLPRQTASNSAT